MRSNGLALASCASRRPSEAPPAALAAFLARRLGDAALTEARIAQLYSRNAPQAFDLPDRGYVARVHPLELWLVAFRLQHPDASLADAVAASEKERQEVYRWLFRTRAKGAQDSRIFTLLEVEAFLDIHRRWARLGYPFGHLVPSLATALGSSGDRPAALAELMCGRRPPGWRPGFCRRQRAWRWLERPARRPDPVTPAACPWHSGSGFRHAR